MSVAPDEARRHDLMGILTYLNMLLFGAGEMKGEPLDDAGRLRNNYHTFATGHLLATMFLLDGDGGLVGRLLTRHGLADLLTPISAILERPLGRTTVGDFVRITRNRLMTHRDFSDGALPPEVREVREDQARLAELQGHMNDLREALLRLGDEVERRLPS